MFRTRINCALNNMLNEEVILPEPDEVPTAIAALQERNDEQDKKVIIHARVNRLQERTKKSGRYDVSSIRKVS